MVSRSRSLFDRTILVPAIRESFIKLDPRVQLRNPVMFIVEVGALVSIFYAFRDARNGQAGFDIANEALQAPEVAKVLQPLGIELVGGSVEEFSSYLDGEMQRWASVVQAAGLRQ